MSRNGSGTYTLPSGNPVVSGTLIDASWANTTLSDLASAMTDSLSRSGQGGMTAALRLFDGTSTVPGLAWGSETTTGWYRAGAGDMRLVVTGSEVMKYLSSGVAVTGTLSATGAATLSSTLAVTGAATLANNLTFSGTGARILGDFSNGTVASRTMFQTSTTNGTTIFPIIPNGSGTQSLFRAYNNSTPTNASYIDVTVDGTVAAINSNREGSGTMLPMSFGVNNAERMRIDTSGNVGIGTSSPGQKLTVGVNGVFRLQTGSVTMDCTPTPGGTDGFVWNTSASSYYDWNMGGSTKVRIDSSGNLLVGTTSQPVATYKVVVNYSGNSSTGGIMFNDVDGGAIYEACYFRKDGAQRGYIRVTTSGTTYATVSDYRLKQDVAPMTGALAKVAALNPCTYKWKESGSSSQGFIAHELQAVVPECVTGEKDAVDAEGNPQYQGIDTSFLVATLTAAIQEQQAIINAQQAALTALTARVEALEAPTA